MDNDPPLHQYWRRQRRKQLLSIAMMLLLYTLTVVLVPPWPRIHVNASELPPPPPPPPQSQSPEVVDVDGTEEDRVYTGNVEAGLVHMMGGAQLDRRVPQKDADELLEGSGNNPKRFGAREEINGKPRDLNIEWNWEFVHHLSADEIFGDGESNDRRNLELRKRGAHEDDGDDEELEKMLGGPDHVKPTLEEAWALNKRQSSQRRRTIHLTFNTCMQPQVNKTANKRPNRYAPQLIVYVSNTTANKAPGPRVKGKAQFHVPLELGYGALDFEATGDVWVGVYAEDIPKNEMRVWESNSPWNYELALSTSAPYHGLRHNQFLYLVDTDDTTALLITGNMTSTAELDGGMNETGTIQEIMDSTPPYAMYAQKFTNDSRIVGLERSYCAVRHLLKAPDSSMTTRGLGNYPKQQFHLKELDPNSPYLGFLTRPRNISDPSDTSGVLWQPMGIQTKRDGNCQIIYNLDFCAEVAYAVPSNPTIFDTLNLTRFYDSMAEAWYQNFTYSLQLIQCNASSDARYSLVRSCDDCAAAYKNWLCAVTIPRCMDFSASLPYLAPRSSSRLFWNQTALGWQTAPFQPLLTDAEAKAWTAAGGWENNTEAAKVPSRNPKIDEVLKPGAYKEVKPCKDLCWSLIQDCPSTMGFSCPAEGSWGMSQSYGQRDHEGDVTCSYLGAVYFLNTAPPGRGGVVWMLLFVPGTVILMELMGW